MNSKKLIKNIVKQILLEALAVDPDGLKNQQRSVAIEAEASLKKELSREPPITNEPLSNPPKDIPEVDPTNIRNIIEKIQAVNPEIKRTEAEKEVRDAIQLRGENEAKWETRKKNAEEVLKNIKDDVDKEKEPNKKKSLIKSYTDKQNQLVKELELWRKIYSLDNELFGN